MTVSCDGAVDVSEVVTVELSEEPEGTGTGFAQTPPEVVETPFA